MTDQTAQVRTITERVEKLEKQNRGLRRAGLFALVAASALLLMGQAAPQFRTVEAERFVLRDVKGKVRATLGMTENGPSLALYDADGDEKERAALAVVGNSPALFLTGPSGRATLTSMTGGSSLTFTDAKGNNRVTIALTEEDISLGFQDSNGKVRFAVGTDNGTPVLKLYDSGEKGRASLALGKDGSPQLTLYDGSGTGRAALRVQPDAAGLLLLDAKEQIRAIMSDEPRIYFFDPNGKVIYTAH